MQKIVIENVKTVYIIDRDKENNKYDRYVRELVITTEKGEKRYE